MYIGWVVEGGYIQKFPSTVLVPPHLYISSTHPNAHTHVPNIAYPLPPKYSYITLTLMRALNDQTSSFNGKPSPPHPTPHTHNYNNIPNFVDLKIGLNQYQAINRVFVWSHNSAPLLRLNPATPRARKLVTALLNITWNWAIPCENAS